MTELAFSCAALLVLFVVAIPVTTLAAKLLAATKRWRAPEITSYASSWGYLYITAPVFVPALWVLSAALHQSEPGGAIRACLEDHPAVPICICALGLAAALTVGGLVVAAMVPGAGRSPSTAASAAAIRQHNRVQRVATTHPRLQRWAGRMVVVEGTVAPACARGLIRPRIELSLDYLDEIDDDMLRAVLLHEIEHVVCGDPLRGLLAEVAMRLNPLAFLLRSEFARWRLAREVACDRHAVRLGADRVALAHALVSGARVGTSAAVPALHSAECDALELRVRLLLDEQGPHCGCGSRRGVLSAVALLAVVVAVPHVAGSEPLDSFHQAVDHAMKRAVATL